MADSTYERDSLRSAVGLLSSDGTTTAQFGAASLGTGDFRTLDLASWRLVWIWRFVNSRC